MGTYEWYFVILQMTSIFAAVIVQLLAYVSRFVSVGDALGRERPATPMSSYFAGRSRCMVT